MKNRKIIIFLGKVLVVFVFFFGLYVLIREDNPSQTVRQDKVNLTKDKKHTTTKKKITGLPKVSTKDWELILVNRDHPTQELNPTLADLNGIQLDARIVDAAAGFLAAAQAIDPEEHLISGYRSVETQAQLFQSYIDQEKANNPSLTDAEAEKLVQTYSQPAGASEHVTGLAMDMGTSNYLNQSHVETVKQIVALAADYGFVLRFPEDKEKITGVGYEDWHYRYVGKASAKYMSEHKLTLEEYIALLKENQ
ncbi:M15 family metallopeptidase [Streptococcus hongkongensis]|nr:D-alanyl-D-alanine carboxypeptidase [Streptococcus uberis]